MTSRPAILSEYTVYRSGEDMVESWRLMNRAPASTTQWRLSSQHEETLNATGLYRYYCNEATNLPSTSFSFILQSTL